MEHEQLIRRVLGTNFLDLKFGRLVVDEDPDAGTSVRLTVVEGDGRHEVEGKGVGIIDALHAGLLARYAREYQSLTTIRLIGFHVSADIETKKGSSGVDAVAQVTVDVSNSEGKHFAFTDASRSMITSSARVVIAMTQYFMNAERAFVTLYNARRDALQRGREDLVTRYTREMSEVVESTSYADVIANIRKEVGG